MKNKLSIHTVLEQKKKKLKKKKYKKLFDFDISK